MLTLEIMPETYAFAQRTAWFRNHLSGGNGTRMGVFTMFYGLYGPYWFPFLREHRGPVLIDELIKDDYQFGLYTSARFSYPEFDSTVFSAVPTSSLHERPGARKTGWVRDRENGKEILDFLDHRDPARPFMTFMFFESPHARYYFPPESVIRRPYAEDVNYATMDVEKDVGLLWNRYVNSCHHLDSQIGRILGYIDEHDLADDTIVVITADHGEEFMEHGRWGHNSDFVREQIQVPLVIHVPGREPETVDRMTSHLDLPATILGFLGVTNPPDDYSLGIDLFGGEVRSNTVLASWDNLVYVDAESFAVFPLKGHNLWRQRYCDRNGVPLPDPDAYLRTRRPRLLEIMRELRRFTH
jgi:membrane-anchored protein YejM (alkaline phosphatase superfamily)